MNWFISFAIITDLPNTLVVMSSEESNIFKFYTTDIAGDGTRGKVIVRLSPITLPDYFPEKHQNMN